MNTSSRNTVDLATSVNSNNEHRAETNNPAAVGLWQKAIETKDPGGSIATLMTPMPQKGPAGQGFAPDVLQQSQFLSRFGGSAAMGQGVEAQAGIFAQVGAFSDQAETLEGFAGGVLSQGSLGREDDAGGAVSGSAGLDLEDLRELDERDDIDVVDASPDFGDTGGSTENQNAEVISNVSGAATPEMRDAKKFATLIERFADRFLMNLDAGAPKQMHVDLGQMLIPDASLVLQQAGSGWTLRAQTKSSEADEKLRLAESALKERFRARGLGEITIDIDNEARETNDASAELA